MTKARDLANIISGGFDATDIPNLDTAKITSGTFADARIPNLDTAKITSGTLADARFPATLPAVSGANLTNLPNTGITMADQWRWTASFTGAAIPVTANWERNDTSFDKIGTGMTNNSGTFSFPQTGIYQVEAFAVMVLNSNSRWNEIVIRLSTDGGSTYSSIAYGFTHISRNTGETTYTNAITQTIIDVTNTSNFKVQISVNHHDTNTTTGGDSNYNNNATTFIRLGDT